VNLLTWTTGAILAAVLVPLLVVLYFLKLRRRPQPIACTLLWKRAVEDLHANAPFQKLRSSLLLLLQLLAILLLAFSVMQPQLRAGSRKGGKTVLLIDNSASMTATDTDDGATRLQHAKRRAIERIEEIHSGGLLSSSAGETMVVAFSDRVEITSRFSSSKQELLDAVERIRPTHGETRIGEALELARAFTTNVDPDSDRPLGEPATLEVFTDGRIHDMDEQVLRGETMMYHRFGADDADNVAVSAIDVKRPFDRPTAVEVFAGLLNYNRRELGCDVQLSVNDTARAVQGITLPAATIDAGSGVLLPGRNNVVFTPFEQPRGAVIEVAILREDDLMADNVVQVVAPPPKRLSVALVAPKNFLIRTVLEGMALERLEVLTTAQYERRAERKELDGYDVVVFDNYAPPEGLMPPGRYLVYGVTPPLADFNEFGRSDAQIMIDWQPGHPALRFVNLDHLFIAECRLVQPSDEVEVLVEGTQGPLVLSVSRGAMHVLYVTFDPAMSNWFRLRSWVTFNQNAVNYLGAIGEGLTSEGFSVGQALTTRLPASATNVELRLPDGAVEPLRPTDPTALSWGPIRLAGLYLLNWSVPESEDRQARPFAVNILSETEGRIDAVQTLEIGQETVAGTAGDAGAYTPLWPYAVGFCLLVLMFEWWVYHKKAFI
jgi:hypothetical protein